MSSLLFLLFDHRLLLIVDFRGVPNLPTEIFPAFRNNKMVENERGSKAVVLARKLVPQPGDA